MNVMLLLQGRGEMAVLSLVIAVLLPHNAMDKRFHYNVVITE
jgi:hypothetical protein